MKYEEKKCTITYRSFDDIKVGESVCIQHELTKEDVCAFARLTGDFNPLHLDETFARKSPFGRPIVYGMLSASFISALVGMVLPGRDALLTSQTLDFLHPAYVGDTLNITATVRRKSRVTRLVLMDIIILNQASVKLIMGRTGAKLMDMENK
jgi:acyl dehydratase